MRGKKMKQTTQQKLDEINRDLFQASLINRLDTLNKIMSTFLFIAIKDSTLNKMTANEIEKVSPTVNDIAKILNENINV
jgi:ATP-dependent Clp protease ATP-binding subunit ClpA